jgi:hypothetical protein
MKQTHTSDVQGEGNYTAAKRYDDAAKKFVDSGKVDAAAKKAAPKTPQEAVDLRAAEAAGASHAKGIKGGEPNMDKTSPAKKAPPANPPVAKKLKSR